MNIEAARQLIRKQALEWLAEVNTRYEIVAARYEKFVATNVSYTSDEIKSITNEIKDLEVMRIRLGNVLSTIKEVRDIEGNPQTWEGYLALLFSDPQFREAEEYRAELWRIAATKELDRLMGLHKYMDGELDFPILTCDAIERQEAIDAEPDNESL